MNEAPGRPPDGSPTRPTFRRPHPVRSPLVLRTPLWRTLSGYRGRRVVSMPPPSSGGVALIEMLNLLETDHPNPPYARLVEHGSGYVYLLEAGTFEGYFLELQNRLAH